MRTLEWPEIETILDESSKLSDNQITAMLKQVERVQPEVMYMFFDVLPAQVAKDNFDMAKLFLDLTITVIWVYRSAFGPAPKTKNRGKWLKESAALLEKEIQALSTEVEMDDAIRESLKQRFFERSKEIGIQYDLIRYCNTRVAAYVEEDKLNRAEHEHLVGSLMFFVVRIFEELYNQGQAQNPKKHK